MNATLSRRPLRRFWGWGAASEHLTQEESSRISMMVQMLGGQITDRPEPQVGDFVLPAPRIAPPAALSAMFTDSPLQGFSRGLKPVPGRDTSARAVEWPIRIRCDCRFCNWGEY